MTNQTNKNHNNQPDINQAPQGYFVQMPTPQTRSQKNLLDLLRVLLDYKRLIAVVVFVCVVISVIIALVITPVYRAEVLLAPAANDNSSKGGVAALASQFGGLASLAGISVGGGGDIETAIATLKSRKFITRFISDFELKQILFESQWDGVKNQWIIDEQSLFSKIKNAILSSPENYEPKGLAPGEPSTGTAYGKFSGSILRVSQDRKTPFVTVSVKWKNPQQASEWANALVQRLNDELRQKTIDEAGRSIDYLTEQISKTSLSELQIVLYRIIEEHTKVITLAKVNDEYVMKVIDPAVPPENPSKPNRMLIVILGLSFGVMLGVFIAFFLSVVRDWKTTKTKESEG